MFSLSKSLRRPQIACISASLALSLVLAAPSFAHDFKAGNLTIDHPTATPTRGTVPVNAGYFTIINAGGVPDRLVSALSPEAGRVELHNHMRGASGMMQMRQVQGGIVVPARGRLQFAPGGLHLMIFNPKAPLRDGGTFPITLVFERAGRVDVVAMVEAPAVSAPRHSH
jgi:periplasmic copper chaperone A